MARLVDCGLSQIFGVDFSKTYFPVHNITYCILILLILIYIYDAKMVDIKTAFYMEIWKKKSTQSVLQV